jgi:hypothetical protein
MKIAREIRRGVPECAREEEQGSGRWNTINQTKCDLGTLECKATLRGNNTIQDPRDRFGEKRGLGTCMRGEGRGRGHRL